MKEQRQSIAFVLLYTVENFWVGLGCLELDDDFIIDNTKMFELWFGCFSLLLYCAEKNLLLYKKRKRKRENS